MHRNLIFYTLVIGVFGLLLWFIFVQGKQLEAERFQQTNVVEDTSTPDPTFTDKTQGGVIAPFLESLVHNLEHPLTLLLLQISTIVLFSRLLGFLFGKIGQPTVIGEIIAGIILGPSVLGLFWPGVSDFLFRADTLQNLQFLSQFGLILFMFIIGLELDLNILKHKAHTAVVVSHASIIFPYFLGVCLAYYLFDGFAPAHISFLGFGLFMGIAMSITAFPVLARIIQERGLTQTPLGALAITCAAADDVTAWCILAVVIAIIQAGAMTTALLIILLSIGYVLAMLYLVRPLLQRVGSIYGTPEHLSKTFIAFIFVVLFLSALFTEAIGIHALFGAFLAGVIMPAQVSFRKLLAAKIEDISLVVLLPLFFAFTGLKTQIGLLNEGNLWVVCGLIILVAVVGKFGSSLVAAKVTGQSWSDSFAIGALMNTRGLIELIVLNIGYDLGILSPTVFTMMVLMALVTTFMTCPALSFIDYFGKRRASLPMQPLQEKSL